MKDEDRTKEQLITELGELHKPVAQFEAAEVERVQTEKGWAQEDLAHEIGGSLSTVQRWERQNVKPSRLAPSGTSQDIQRGWHGRRLS